LYVSEKRKKFFENHHLVETVDQSIQTFKCDGSRLKEKEEEKLNNFHKPFCLSIACSLTFVTAATAADGIDAAAAAAWLSRPRWISSATVMHVRPSGEASRHGRNVVASREKTYAHTSSGAFCNRR
jgi:hypothetical protein